LERKLAAILCADVYGYSRLMGEDEEATLRTLKSHRKLIDSAIDQHHGRFVNSAGDSVLAEFASVVEAVNCAVEIQSGLKAENADLPAERTWLRKWQVMGVGRLLGANAALPHTALKTRNAWGAPWGNQSSARCWLSWRARCHAMLNRTSSCLSLMVFGPLR